MQESADEDHVLPADATAALEMLGPADLLRLEKIARLYTRGVPHAEWCDLFQTAIERVITGTRKWPKHVSIVTFMAGVMRSIANEYWQQHNRTLKVGVFLETDLSEHDDSGKDGIIDRTASNSPDPERELLAKEELAKIEALFIDDEQAWVIVMARAEGYAPDDIQENFEMTKTQYNSALKRIRRKLLRCSENRGSK